MSIQISTWWERHALRWGFVKGSVMLVVWLTVSTAQVTTHITPDNTLNTIVTPSGAVYDITGGTRPENGSNLFHSFDRFNVGTGDTAHFLGAPGVDNIIGRVTGGAESMIYGRLQADATLFLLNPSGIMFGPNATLDIRGSFYASTADVLRFEDGSEFATSMGGQSSLSVAAPSAFGFVHPNPADIAIQGSTLEVSEGEALSILGGDIGIAGGNIRAPSGQINLASVASVGDMTLDGVRPDTTGPTALGSITITGSQLEASGQVSGRLAGQIVIRGGQLTVAQSRIRVTNRSDQGGGGVDIGVDHAITINGTDILSDTLDIGKGGHIVLQAASLTLDAEARIRSETFGAGSGGDITLAVETLELTGNATISSNSLFSTGAAGYIMIHGRGGNGTAAQSVTLRGSTLSTQVAGQGDEGTITITAEAVNLDRANLTAATTGAGDAGDIILNVGHLNATQQTIISSSSTAQGAAGIITVHGLQADSMAHTVTLHNSTLQTNATGQGTGGTITVTAEAVTLDNAILSATVNAETSGGATNRTADIILTTPALTIVGGRILAETTGARRAGNITLNVSHLTASQQAVISSSSSRSQATGAAGSVTIRGQQGDGTVAQTITLDNASVRSDTRSSEQGGDISVQAETLSLTNGAELSSNTIGAGPGGGIAVQAGTLTLDNRALIRSDTFGEGSGGDITLAVETLALTGNATISSNSPFSTGAAGDITIHGRRGDGTAAQSVALRDDSTLSTEVAGHGAGGTITVTAEVVDLDHANLIAATAGAGAAGDITMNVNHLSAARQTTMTSSSTETAMGDAGDITIQGLPGTDAAATVMVTDSTLRTETAGGTGGKIMVMAEALSLANANLTAATTGAGAAGDITLNVGHLSAVQQTTITSSSTEAATGDAGDITIQGLPGTDAAAVTVTDSMLRTSTEGSGAGGMITVTAEAVDLANTSLTATTRGAGRAGDIMLNVGRLSAARQTTITTSSSRGTGVSGSVTIRGLQGDASAAQAVILDNASMRNETSSPEQGGEISVQTETLSLSHQSELRSNTFGDGPGGRIALQAEMLILDGKSSIQSDTFGANRGGAIELAVGNIMLTGSATISSNSPFSTGAAGDITIHGRGGHGTVAQSVALRDDSTLSTETAEGAGGTITITAHAVELTHANLTAATTGSGHAGAITLNVDHLNATEQTLITSSSTETATGNAGSVTIQGLGGAGTAASRVMFSDSAVRTQAESEQADGGAIRVQAQLIRLRDESAIRSDTARGQRGGNIDLDAALVVLENSDIIANSEAAQEKADINISGALIDDPRSVVQASGGISILGSVFDSSSVVQLPLAFLHQTALLQQRCAQGLRGSQASSLALVGRDGLPLEPGHMLLSNLPIGEHQQVQESQRPQTHIEGLQALSPVAWTFDCDK